jgi:hypothetical protein
MNDHAPQPLTGSLQRSQDHLQHLLHCTTGYCHREGFLRRTETLRMQGPGPETRKLEAENIRIKAETISLITGKGEAIAKQSPILGGGGGGGCCRCYW